MGLVGAGDRRAQRVLAHRLAPRVLRIAQRLLPGSADAEDASQLALIEVLQSASTYSGESSIERWADRITARTAIRYARDQRRAPWHKPQSTDGTEVPVSGRVSTACEEAPKKIESYLAQIPIERREVLVLKHVLGCTVEEIAEMTGTPLGTVKDRLIAARRQVRKMIQRDIAIGVQRGN